METWTAKPPPRTPITWEMSGKRSRQKTEGRREWFKQSTESQRTASRQKHGQPMYCGIAVFVSWLCIRLSVWRLIEARNHLRNQSCSFNSTDKTNTEVPFLRQRMCIYCQHTLGYDVVCWFVQPPQRLVSITRLRPQQRSLHPPQPDFFSFFNFTFINRRRLLFLGSFFFFHFSISSQWQKALEVWN